MKIKQFLLICLVWMSCAPLGAQTSKEEMFSNLEQTGGVYLVYPEKFSEQTKAPKGYKPFYVSHYSRHGSRYLIGDRDYKWVLDLLNEAHEAGALTPLGVRQHRGIAGRMFASFPEVFKGERKISARSTVVLRCAMSMVAFGDKLKELNPGLQMTYEASEKYMDYMNFHTDESNRFTSMEKGPLAEEYRKFEKAHTNPDRLMATLFADSDFVLKKVNPENLMWGLYWIASDMQDMETKMSFYDIFEPQELFDLWQCINYRFYAGNANHAAGNGIVVANAKSLLRNILDSADEAIEKGDIAATLRFGHDGNVIPLLAILGIENFNVAVSDPYEVYKYWCDFKAVPMASNVQIIFFKKDKGSNDDILVKFLHNENEVKIPVKTDNYPFYKWSDVEAYYRGILD